MHAPSADVPSPEPIPRLGLSDALLVLALFGLNALLLWKAFDFRLPPYEDAAILMRYSENIAHGHGIVWNVGEKPVDGATDFLFMMALAGATKLGLTVERATQVLGIATHLLTCVVIYLGMRRLHGGPRWPALLSGAVLAVGPGLRYVEAYFGTPFFALFSATTWYLAYAIFKRGTTPVRSIGFAVSALVLGLTRPDGVFLAVFMLAGLVLCRGWSRSRRVVRDFAVIFGGLGAVYFVWRWWYFGYPLPNPFYVKGGGQIYPAHLVVGLQNVIALCAPFVPILVYASLGAIPVLLVRSERGAARRASVVAAIGLFGMAALFVVFRHSVPRLKRVVELCGLLFAAGGAFLLVGRSLLERVAPDLGAEDEEGLERAKEAVWVLVTLGLFGAIWIFLSNGMDYMMRYHYAVVPIALMSWPPLLGWILRSWGVPPPAALDGGRRVLRLLAIVLFSVAALGYEVTRFPPVRLDRWGTLDVARILADYDHGYGLAVTNAGQLPLYSGWRTLDAWGLSDQWITHHGGITEDYLAQFHPHVIQFDAVFSPLDESIAKDASVRNAAWYQAIRVLHDYAVDHHYVLAAAFGNTAHEAHYYYVRPDFPESDEIVRRIRGVDYHVDGSPEVAFDWAHLAPPQ